MPFLDLVRGKGLGILQHAAPVDETLALLGDLGLLLWRDEVRGACVGGCGRRSMCTWAIPARAAI